MYKQHREDALVFRGEHMIWREKSSEVDNEEIGGYVMGAYFIKCIIFMHNIFKQIKIEVAKLHIDKLAKLSILKSVILPKENPYGEWERYSLSNNCTNNF